LFSITDKFKAIEKSESCVTVTELAADHGVGVTALKDIENKESVRKFAAKSDVDTGAGKGRDKRGGTSWNTSKRPLR
jgi:hypothetical protein